ATGASSGPSTSPAASTPGASRSIPRFPATDDAMRERAERTPTPLLRVQAGRLERGDDQVATEEPLEIRLIWGGESHTVAATMRTPGNDPELAAGFLFSEGVIAGPEALAGFASPEPNVVEVALATPELPELKT